MPEFADVSVIMPAYKAEATIARALTSIAAQTVLPKDVIIVDDGSPDGTYKVAQQMADKMNGVTLLLFRQDNLGPGAARNHALTKATGKYVAFLDADDEWLPEKLERSMAHLSRHDYDLVSHNGWVVEGDGTSSDLDCASRFEAYAEDPFVGLYEKGFIDTCTVVCRRDKVFEAGGFDPDLPVGQDFDLFLTLLGRPEASFFVFRDPLVKYHITPGSVTSHTWRRLKCQIRILKRHAPALKGHKGCTLKSLWFRTLAIHYEALTVFKRRKEISNILAVCCRLPFVLLCVTVQNFTGFKDERIGGLARAANAAVREA